jgi:hypothetical protein
MALSSINGVTLASISAINGVADAGLSAINGQTISAGGSSPVFDAATAGFAGATSGPITFSHTCTGSNRLLLIGISYLNSLAITAATYNGVAMTYVTDSDNTNGGANIQTRVWRLIAPATGSNTVSLTVMGGTGSFSYLAQSFTGVNQTTAIGTPATGAENESTTATTTVTGSAGELFADFVGTLNTPTTTTAGAGQTERGENLDATFSIFGSTEAGGASVVMDWTLGAARWSASVGVPIKPV